MKKKLLFTVVICGISVVGADAKDSSLSKGSQLNIAFVDSFEAMRKCKDGKQVGDEIDLLRDKASKELKTRAESLAKDEAELKNKASMLKPQELAKQERDFAKKKRDLEEFLREEEENIKITMQQKTEKLAIKIEEGIVAVAKEKNVDAVIDKMTGRVMYTKEDKKGDITKDAIQFVDKKSDLLAQAQKEGTTDPKTAIAKADGKPKSAAAA